MIRLSRFLLRLFSILIILMQNIFIPASTPAFAEYTPGIPPAVDPGTPTFSGLANPVPAEPVAYNPSTSMLQAIFNADVAAGGTSFWIDRILARPFLSADFQSALFTRGRALFMYSHSPGTLGFAGGYAYRERPTGANQNLYTISVSGAALSETTSQRVQYPSHWRSLFTRSGLSVLQRKYITDNNVAVTTLTITNTSASATSVTVTASSPIATTNAGGTELTGSVTLRYGLSTINPRLSGDSFTVSGTTLTRNISLNAGQSITFKVQMGMLANEIPESSTDYTSLRNMNANTAFLTHLQVYNQWWVDNVPYIDIPNNNIKKMSYYRMFLNRYNYFDGNIPGNDFQFPVSIEGVMGYNNAIQLTQPMHMQDLKYFRNPIYSYGNWISSGESSKYGPFTDNPGDTAHWGVGAPNGTYEQYIGREAWNSYKVHGGESALLNNLARYAEGDVTGYLAKYDQNNNFLISYVNGADTGNDADAVALAFFQREQERTETSFWWEGARAAAEAYTLLGNTSKANQMNTLANNMRTAILTLWDNAPVSSGGQVFKMRDIQSGSLVPWKDQQNWAPFIAGPDLVANTASFREALRFYADEAQMPIMPSYTANQADKAEAVAAGRGGSNNFSNINWTLQTQVFLSALRNYPSAYITQDSYRKSVEWLTWTQYINGDNRLPDNNEFWFNWNPTNQTLGRSGIHHNILGAFNFMIIEGFMGVVPRADDIVELWPIDVGYEYFTVNNLRYHGQNYTIVWDRPGGTDPYANAPEGYSLYLNGQRVFTVSDLTRLTWNSNTGQVTILGTPATVSFNTSASLPTTLEVSHSGNSRMVDIAQKAGVDISTATGGFPNLAFGKVVSASFTTTSPTLQSTNPNNAVDGFTVSGLPAQVGNWIGRNPIWGSQGSPNTQDWFEVNLGAQTTFDTVKLYFYSNKTFGIQGNTYRQPASYSVQFFNGSSWVDVSGQAKTPAAPLPNYNKVTFPAVTAQRMRILMTRTGTFGIGLKEVQVFNTGQGGQLPSLTVHYPFEGNANDSSGNGRNGTLVNGPTFVAGQIGQAVDLAGGAGGSASQHVSMPASVINGLTDFTVATWVRLDTTSAWRRIFDFGTGTTVNMFLTPQSGSGTIRFAITTGGGGAEQQINGTSALPTGAWTHVAVTKSGNVGTLYVNGVQVGQNTAMTLSPSSLGNTTQNWIGRSQYAGDPFLDGQVDDFRIYNGALSASEVQALANVSPTGPVTWYRFDETSGTTAADSAGTNNATLVNGPTFVAGRLGNAVNLDGTNDHVSMPTGIVNGLTNFSIATWVRLDTTSAWRRIFDFGTGTTVNMFLTPQSGSSTVRFAITTGGAGGEQQINGTPALSTGVWTHVAVTKSGNTGILYVNGVQVGQNTSMTLSPSSLGNTTQNWIGRSQYAGDPFLDGQVDDFRIYNRALSVSEVQSLASGSLLLSIDGTSIYLPILIKGADTPEP